MHECLSISTIWNDQLVCRRAFWSLAVDIFCHVVLPCLEDKIQEWTNIMILAGTKSMCLKREFYQQKKKGELMEKSSSAFPNVTPFINCKFSPLFFLQHWMCVSGPVICHSSITQFSSQDTFPSTRNKGQSVSMVSHILEIWVEFYIVKAIIDKLLPVTSNKYQ